MGLILGLKMLETKRSERVDKKAIEQGLRILAHMIARAYVREWSAETAVPLLRITTTISKKSVRIYRRIMAKTIMVIPNGNPQGNL